MHWNEVRVVLDVAKCLFENFGNFAFSGESLSNEHETMSNQDCFVELNALEQEVRFWL